MGEITYLDLDRVRLFGFERYKDVLNVDLMVRGIEKGDDFPPVLAMHVAGDVYQLVGRDGGHHRAVAHYIVKKPLKVELVEFNMDCVPHVVVAVKDIMLYDPTDNDD